MYAAVAATFGSSEGGVGGRESRQAFTVLARNLAGVRSFFDVFSIFFFY